MKKSSFFYELLSKDFNILSGDYCLNHCNLRLGS